jgi:hypothetical protein
MRAHLFPFPSVTTQSDLCFTNVYARICLLFVHFYEHARQLSAHTRAHAEITCTPLSCGGDECDADALSLLRQSNIQTCMPVCMRIFIFGLCFFAFLSTHASCLPNSLFLLDTGNFICPTTSCRPCQPTYLPDFHRFGKCVCFS